MSSRIINPFIVGRGRSGQAIARCLGILREMQEFDIQPIRWIERGESLRGFPAKTQTPVLFIANPHGLHARTVLEGEKAGFETIFCEKPVCVGAKEADQLRKVRSNVAIFHVYRQMWGPQTLKTLIKEGEVGDIFSIEGKFWHSSTAERAQQGASHESKPPLWKNDAALSGPSDALLDVGTHWADLAIFLAGEKPIRAETWKSHVNAETPHRDSHVQIALEFSKNRRALGSISKMVHGAGNELEIHVLGSRKAVSWYLLRPDEIVIGEGRDRRIVTRKQADLGAKLPPFHGAGWLEGYIEIIRQGLKGSGEYPTLRENLDMLDMLFAADKKRFK